MLRKAAEQVRKITEGFGGQGLGTVREGDVWIIAGVPIPPAHEALDGIHRGDPARRHPVRPGGTRGPMFRANTPRPDPPPPTWWTEAEVKKHLGLSDSQFAAAKASGFPQSNGRRDLFDHDGIPSGSVALWTSELVQKWATTIRSLQPAGR